MSNAANIDPATAALDALDQAARRQQAEVDGAEALSKARIAFILDRSARGAFFAALLWKLESVAAWSLPTMATDGKRLIYNPEFVAGMNHAERIGVLCHEVLHCVSAHFARRGARDARKFNVACDLAINCLVRDAGYALPEGALFAGEGEEPFKSLPTGLSAEEYYNLLPDEGGDKGPGQPGKPGDGQGGDGDGAQCDDPGGCGGIIDAGDPAGQRERKADWEIGTANAERASKSRGALPGGLGRAVDEIVRPSVDWRELLREFIRSHAKNDYSWSTPNRRFISQGLYLPSLRSEELGELAIAIDVSGSIGPAELKVFASEMNAILELYPVKVTVIYHDAVVVRVQEWEPSDGELKLQACGGGGTSHKPVFEHIERSGEQPVCMIALTDLCTEFPAAAPGYPVLWASTGGEGAQAPFGEVVQVKAN